MRRTCSRRARASKCAAALHTEREQHDEEAEEAEFFAERREHEIGMAGGNHMRFAEAGAGPQGPPAESAHNACAI